MSMIDKVNNLLDNISSENRANEGINEIIDKRLTGVLKVLSGKALNDDNFGDSGKYAKEIDSINDKLIDNVVSFIGASGGVGSTTTLINVAYYLKKLGKSVIVIDLDILNPSIKDCLECGMKKTPSKDLVSYLTGSSILGECIYSTESKIAVMSAYNRTIADYIFMDNSSVANALSNMINQLKRLFDVVLIDIPNKVIMSDIVGQAIYDSNLIYMVWNEALSCVNGTENLKINMSRLGIPYESKVRGIVFNARTSIDYPKYPIEQSGIKLITILPYDSGIKESGLRGEVFMEKGLSRSKFSEAYCNNIEYLSETIINDCKGRIDNNTNAKNRGEL